MKLIYCMICCVLMHDMTVYTHKLLSNVTNLALNVRGMHKALLCQLFRDFRQEAKFTEHGSRTALPRTPCLPAQNPASSDRQPQPSSHVLTLPKYVGEKTMIYTYQTGYRALACDIAAA